MNDIQLLSTPPTHLRTARKRAGLSQLALAVRAGLSLNTISLAERSGRMSAEVAQRIAPVLNVPADTLIAGANSVGWRSER